MTEIIIDVTRLINRYKNDRLPTGVDRVSLAYIEHFKESAIAAIRYNGKHVFLPKSRSQKIFQALLKSETMNAKDLSLWSDRIVSSLKNQNGNKAFLFNTGHSGLEKASYPFELKKINVRPIFMVHDIIPLTHPEFCRAGEKDKHTVRLKNILTSGAGVIANSEATLEVVTEFSKNHQLNMPHSIAALLAPANLPYPSSTRPIQESYFVAIGTIEPRKNYLTLLRIWRRLVEKLGPKAPKLVIVGQRGWECENVVDMLERCDLIKDHVIELSSCTDSDLSTYLKHAQALLFPSITEGFGLPVVEALSLGTPVLASDLQVYRETAGEIPEYIDPLDTMKWLVAIERYMDSKDAGRVSQIEKLKNYKAPTWKQHFKLVDQFLADLR